MVTRVMHELGAGLTPAPAGSVMCCCVEGPDSLPVACVNAAPAVGNGYGVCNDSAGLLCGVIPNLE